MQQPKVYLATTLLNARVRNSAGENLGKVEDIIVDSETGNIDYAVLSFGGLLGMGEKLVPIPWRSLSVGPERGYVLLNVDKESLQRAPAFDRGAIPDVADPMWRRSINDYYGTTPRAFVERPVVDRPVVARPVYAENRPIRRTGLSVVGGIALVILIAALAWASFLVATRGWDQAREDMKSSIQRVAYAAKETSRDAALTTKVKTALTLSKRIPADKINVDSDGDVVTLRGEVPSDDIRSLAESLARDVPGVGDVHNHLYVVSRSQ